MDGGDQRPWHLGLVAGGLVFLSVFLSIFVGASSLQPGIVDQQEFRVIGILVRTSNAKEMSGQGAIGGQWARFFKEGLLDKIPGKVDATIYAVYTGYESDRNGEYDFLIGAKVSSTAAVPPGMVERKVLKGSYAVITSANGPAEQVVPKAWQEVWSLEDKKQISRAYKTDFEVYDQRSSDPKNSRIDIYVGLK